MRNIQIFSDKLAISLSLLCAIHCLALPLIVVLLPSMIAMQLDNEAFHFWMLLVVIPTSTYALTMGCRIHKHYRLLALGVLGLLFLISAVFIGTTFLGEIGEKMLTLIGASLVALGHYWNYRLCQSQEHCQCPEHHDSELR